MKLCLVIESREVGLTLAGSEPATPRRQKMILWVLVGIMAVVGGFWVKTRRQRKAKALTYAGND